MLKVQTLKFIDRVVGSLIVYCCSPPGSPSESISINSILLIRPGGIGDAVLLIPLIDILKKAYPEATIDVLAEKRNARVFVLNAHIHWVASYDKPKELLKIASNRYDVVIDTEQWHRLSAVVARLIRAPVLIGYSTNDRKKLFTDSIDYSHDDYEMDSFFHLLSPLGIPKLEKIEPPYLVIPDSVSGKVESLLGESANGPYVVIFPGASIPERRWGGDRFRTVAERLNAQGFSVVVVGGNEEVSDGERIVAGNNGLNLAGKTNLAETAAVINKGAVLVSGDSGILHIGVGLGKPTVSLFGPGITKKWAPTGADHIVINKNLPCSPCTKFGYTPNCRIDAKCMSDISVDEVVAAVEKLLAQQVSNDRVK